MRIILSIFDKLNKSRPSDKSSLNLAPVHHAQVVQISKNDIKIHMRLFLSRFYLEVSTIQVFIVLNHSAILFATYEYPMLFSPSATSPFFLRF